MVIKRLLTFQLHFLLLSECIDRRTRWLHSTFGDAVFLALFLPGREGRPESIRHLLGGAGGQGGHRGGQVCKI